MKLERRAFELTDLEIRTDDEKKIRGYAAVFDKLSVPLWGFREKIARGAFAKSLNDDDVRALWNHDPNYVLGRNRSGSLRLEEDDKGLMIEITPPDTQWARDLVVSIERGDVNQMSFGFETIQDDWDQGDPKDVIRTLREVKLYDVSPVTFPAYPQTTVGVRTLQEVFEENVKKDDPAFRQRQIEIEEEELL